MRYRHGLPLLAAALLTAGCAVAEPTTQTSMLRGPTPSSGLSIPQLLEIPSPSGSEAPTAAADSIAAEQAPPAESADAAAPTTEELPAPTAEQEPTPDEFPTETFPTDQPDQTAEEPLGDGTGVPDLSVVAASFGCTDFIDQLPGEPLAVNSAVCVLDDQQVLLYSFSNQQAATDYLSLMEASGVTADELMLSEGYVIMADPAPMATIKAALGAG